MQTPRGASQRLNQSQFPDLARRVTLQTPAQAFPGIDTANRTEWKAKDHFRAIRLWYGVV